RVLFRSSGGFRQYVATQEEGDAFFCVVDLHSITTPFEPDVLREATLAVAAWLFATGLDPERSTVFVQSHVTAHPEAAWLLSAVASYGQLGRMTQFKEKGDQQGFVSAALFNYPVLMAGDILLYQATHVPIGDDRRQFKTAVTDSGSEVRRGEDKPGITNLIDILAVATGETPEAIEARYDGSGYGQFKSDVAEAVIALLEPIAGRYSEFRNDPAEL